MVLVVGIPYEVFPFKVLCALPATTEYLEGLVVFAFVALSKSIYEQSHTYTSYKSAELVFQHLLTFSSVFPRCCQAHDQCYSKAKLVCAASNDTPYTKTYKYSCENKAITCSSTCCPEFLLCSVSLCLPCLEGMGLRGHGCGRDVQQEALRGAVLW